MKKAGICLAILSGILFGAAGIFIRYLSAAGFDNQTIIFTRMLGALPFMFIFLYRKDKTLLKIGRREFIPVACSALLGMFCTNLCCNIACVYLSLALEAVLVSIAPVYVLLISRFLFNEKITMGKLVCAMLSVLGCILVSGVVGSKVELSVLGLTAGIISGITYGLYSIFSKLAMQKGVRSLTIIFYSILLITIVTAPMAHLAPVYSYIAAAPVKHILFMLVHSLCMGVLSYLCLTMALERIDAGQASMLASCEPAASMVFGMLLFSEIPTVFSVIGLLLTITALTLLAKQK